MIETLITPDKSLSVRSTKAQSKGSPPFRWSNKTNSKRTSVLPLMFHCLGGKWNGEIHYLQPNLFLLRIQGLPPVQVGQELQFQGVGTLEASYLQLTHGIIQHISTQSGFSVWERTTGIYLKLNRSLGVNTFPLNSQKDSSHEERGGFIVCQVADKEVLESHEMELYAPGLSFFQASWESNKKSLHAGLNLKNGTIRSTRLSLPNACGQTIQTYHDFPIDMDIATLPIVVIAPGYGETKRDYVTLAYYFASNGFHVIRYDHTNHVGESNGDHVDITLTSMKQDFQAVTQYVGAQWPAQPIVGVAASLASRVAIKAEVEHPSLSLFISLMGIVDVQQSLAIVHQEDLFAGYVEGKFPESANVLGFNVGSVFLQDALENKFATFESMIRDSKSFPTPMILVSAENDAWVEPQAVQVVSDTLASKLAHHYIVPNSLHRLQENPKAAQATYRCLLQQCRNHLSISSGDQVIHDPDRLTLGRQKRKEKIAQQQSLIEIGIHFWQDYLEHFRWIAKCPDYVKLLDHMFHVLGPLSSGQQVLDVGCGNGNAGVFFLHELQGVRNGDQTSGESPIHYTGIDLVSEALDKAKSHMTHTLNEMKQGHPTFAKNLQFSWAQVDLQQSLPFADNQFDRIVSNLVLGYLKNSRMALQELYRVLAPGGRMVLSNLKPNGDFSGIYRNLVEEAGEPEQREEARRLLHNYGKIRQAEKENYFRFFDESEWQNLLRSLGCLSSGVYPTFANQAYLIVLEKPLLAPRTIKETVRKVLPLPRIDSASSAMEQAA